MGDDFHSVSVRADTAMTAPNPARVVFEEMNRDPGKFYPMETCALASRIISSRVIISVDMPSRVTHIEGMANAIAATGYRVEPEAAMRDFSSSTLAALAARGIRVVGLTVIPSDGDLPFATGSRGYRVDDNGCGRIWTFAQVKGAAQ